MAQSPNRRHNSPKVGADAKDRHRRPKGMPRLGFLGLTDVLTLARRAVVGAAAPTESAEHPFYVVTASADGESIRDRAGASFPVAASFEAFTTCDAIIAPSFWPGEEGKPPDMSRFGLAAAWLRRHHARGALIAGCGSGALLPIIARTARSFTTRSASRPSSTPAAAACIFSACNMTSALTCRPNWKSATLKRSLCP